jgi:RNA polymerase sigma-70 factor (ECF subfamily)
MTDADLLRGARAGDAEAWRVLYGRYLPGAWRQACALSKDRHAAEDITSEAMLALLRNLDRLEGDAAAISAWLRSVIRCKAADHYRRVFRAGDRVAFDEDNVLAPGMNGGPGAPLEVEESRTQIQRVLEQLPERQRIVLEWKYLDGMRVHEMAVRLGETERAVETVLYRARREFRRLFDLAELGTLKSMNGTKPAAAEADRQRVL